MNIRNSPKIIIFGIFFQFYELSKEYSLVKMFPIATHSEFCPALSWLK